MFEERFMKRAFELALVAKHSDEVPVGAVIVKNGKVISEAFNAREKKRDATAHAEILAIKKACKKLKDFRLLNCDLYVTLEPCVMCMGAAINARIENVYFGASISNGSISASEISERAVLNFKTNVQGGYMKAECSELISNYFKEKRNLKSQRTPLDKEKLK